MPGWVFENTLVAAILAAIVVLASRAARLAPAIRHGLWLVVLIKLITPPVFSITVPLPATWQMKIRPTTAAELSSPRLKHDSQPKFPTAPADGEPLDVLLKADGAILAIDAEHKLPGDIALHEILATYELPDDAAEEQVAVGPAPIGETIERGRNPSRVPDAVPAAASVVSGSSVSMAYIAWQALVVGSCLAVLIQVLRLLRLKRLIDRALPAPGDHVALVAELAGRLGIRAPFVRVSRDVHSPIVCALDRAVLIWPMSGQASLRGAALRAVIVHELAHLARRDHWVGWLELAAACAWWWNPLFCWVQHQVHENAELACDAWATALFPDTRRDYARALLDLAEMEALQPAAVPALSVGDGSRKLFERRLIMILGERMRHKIGAPAKFGIALLGLTALVGCSASLAANDPIATENNATFQGSIDDAFAPVTVPRQEPAGPVQPPAALGPTPIAVDSEIPSIVVVGPQSNDERLKRLEDRFDTLIAELRALKTAPAAAPPPPNADDVPRARDLAREPMPSTPLSLIPIPVPASQRTAIPAAVPFPPATSRSNSFVGNGTGKKAATIAESARSNQYNLPIPMNYPVPTGQAEGEPVVLTRATYKMAAGKADAIAEFLKAHLSDDVEVRVKEGALQVTATSSDQAAISQFLHLLRTRAAAIVIESPAGNGAKPKPQKEPRVESPKTSDFSPRDAQSILPAAETTRLEALDDEPARGTTLPAATPGRR